MRRLPDQVYAKLNQLKLQYQTARAQSDSFHQQQMHEQAQLAIHNSNFHNDSSLKSYYFIEIRDGKAVGQRYYNSAKKAVPELQYLVDRIENAKRTIEWIKENARPALSNEIALRAILERTTNWVKQAEAQLAERAREGK